MSKVKKQEPAAKLSFSFKNSYIIIAALSVLLYANTLKHGFVLDDIAVVENNKFVHEGFKGIPKILSTFYWEGYWQSNAGLYRPLSLVTFAVEYQLSPANPVIHHLVNIVLYALTCCLLFQVLCSIFKNIDQRFFLFAVLLFVVHPIHTEVVANIKSRDEILALLFFLLCCKQLYAAAENGLKQNILAAVFFFLALLSKEGAVVFLPIIFLLDYRTEKNVVQLLRKRAAVLVATVLWLALHQYVIRTSPTAPIAYTYMDNSLYTAATALEQRATAFGMFTRYVVKAFFPYELSYDYSFNQIPIIGFASVLALAGLALFAGFIYLVLKNFKRDVLLAFSLLMLVLPLCLTGNLFFNIGATMADRFLFVPTIGSCILICWLFYKALKTDITTKQIPTTIQYAVLAIVLVFSIRSFSRNKDWKDNYTLFQKDVNTVPNSARARYNNALVLQQLNDGGDLSASRKEYEASLKIDPEYVDALINLGVVYTKQKEYAAAVDVYKRALKKNPGHPDVLGNMGEALFRKGDTDSAIVYLNKAHKAGNHNGESYNILGTIFFGKQNYQEAQATFEEGIKNDTTNWSMYLNYGNVLAVSNKFEGALNAFQHSYKLNANNPQTSYFLALTYAKLGDTLTANKYMSAFQQLNKK